MPTKRLAMTTDGKLTYCTADDEHVGKGRCNHVAHQKVGETQEAFLERASQAIPDQNRGSLKDLSEIKTLDEMIPEMSSPIDGGDEGIVADKNGELRYVRLFNISDLDKNGDTEMLDAIESSDAEVERVFKEKGLPYQNDSEENLKTYIEHILTRDASYNPHLKFGEPRIEMDQCIGPEAAWGYSWPLDQVIDHLDDGQLAFPFQVETDWESDGKYIDPNNSSVRRLYNRLKYGQSDSVEFKPEQDM